MSDTKICCKCKEEKPLSEYYFRKDGPNGPMKHRYNCKVCHSAEEKKRREQPEIKERARVRAQKWYAENKEYAREKQKEYQRKHPEVARRANVKYRANNQLVIDWLIEKYGNNPCEECGHWFPWCAMDFDHRPDEGKEFGLGTVGHSKATPERLAKVEKEIAKCDLVCSNCHRIRTHITRKKDV
jgi:hypothetical protein